MSFVKFFWKNRHSPLGVVMNESLGQNLCHRHKHLICYGMMRHMTKFLCFWRKLSFWPLFEISTKKCLQMIYNMLYFKLNFTLTVSEHIGRFKKWTEICKIFNIVTVSLNLKISVYRIKLASKMWIWSKIEFEIGSCPR